MTNSTASSRARTRPGIARPLYGWGEIMLSDFDDIDKHLADPHKLFSNIQSIKELDHSDFLTPAKKRP